jgi:SAM-dependent methyltransferase
MMNPAEFDNIARSEERFWWYRGQREILNRVLDPIARAHRFDRVLEVGSGTGYQSKVLTERYGWQMVPLDLGWEGLSYARKMGLSRLVQADMTALPFPAASFPMVISMDAVVHLPRGEEHRAFAEFARVLKPEGWLAIRVSALDLLRSRHAEFAMERQRFTKSRLVQRLAEAGFQVQRATYCNSLLFPVALFKFRVWEPLTNQAPSSGVEPVAPWLDSLLYAPLRAEAALVGSGWSLPVGQSLLAIARKAR